MPAPTRRFPDVLAVLVDALEELAGSGHVAVETPADMESRLPFVRVTRVAGDRNRLEDLPVIDVDVFASSYSAGRLLADDIAEWLIGPPPAANVFDRVDCEVAPRELPWGDDVRRFNASYRVILRRRLAA